MRNYWFLTNNNRIYHKVKYTILNDIIVKFSMQLSIKNIQDIFNI